jgi:hypothetical protein
MSRRPVVLSQRLRRFDTVDAGHVDCAAVAPA